MEDSYQFRRNINAILPKSKIISENMNSIVLREIICLEFSRTRVYIIAIDVIMGHERWGWFYQTNHGGQLHSSKHLR